MQAHGRRPKRCAVPTSTGVVQHAWIIYDRQHNRTLPATIEPPVTTAPSLAGATDGPGGRYAQDCQLSSAQLMTPGGQHDSRNGYLSRGYTQNITDHSTSALASAAGKGKVKNQA